MQFEFDFHMVEIMCVRWTPGLPQHTCFGITLWNPLLDELRATVVAPTSHYLTL
jgi:hypothetical protein